MRKKLLATIGVLAAVVVVAAVALTFVLGSIVRAAVNKFGPAITKTKVELTAAELSPLTGSGTITGLFVGNPPGWRSDRAVYLGKMHLSVVPTSLLGDHIIIREIVIDQPEFVYETKVFSSNIRDLLKNIGADLSAGGLDSINALTDRILQRVDSWDDIVASLAALAEHHHVFLCKDDVRQAFRCVPVRFEDHHLLCFQWKGMWFYDRVLQFGGRSAPALWDRPGKFLRWLLMRRGFTTFQFVDDFCVALPFPKDLSTLPADDVQPSSLIDPATGLPVPRVVERAWHGATAVFTETNTPTSPKKRLSPTRALVFLGLLIDMLNLTLSITRAKKQHHRVHDRLSPQSVSRCARCRGSRASWSLSAAYYRWADLLQPNPRRNAAGIGRRRS